jgi:hypothetical protein
VGWLDYLKSNSIKDLVRLGIRSEEFKTNFVNGKSDETLACTLYDVLLAREADDTGLTSWTECFAGQKSGDALWDSAVNSILESDEYNVNFGDDAVPGGGRAGCGPLVVMKFYCRVLQRPLESEVALAGWLEYLKSNTGTVKGMVRDGILSEEFKTNFVNGRTDENLARTLYDVLLAREGDAVDLNSWAGQIGDAGWDSAVDSIMASDEYKINFGNDAVPGGGRAVCASKEMLVEQLY